MRMMRNCNAALMWYKSSSCGLCLVAGEWIQMCPAPQGNKSRRRKKTLDLAPRLHTTPSGQPSETSVISKRCFSATVGFQDLQIYSEWCARENKVKTSRFVFRLGCSHKGWKAEFISKASLRILEQRAVKQEIEGVMQAKRSLWKVGQTWHKHLHT